MFDKGIIIVNKKLNFEMNDRRINNICYCFIKYINLIN